MPDKEVLVVVSKVKAYIKTKELKTSSDVFEGLDAKLRAIIDAAAEKTKADKRATLRASDL